MTDNTELSLELHRLKSDVGAIDVLVTTAIQNLIHISPTMRTAFEELLGTVRAFNATALPATTDSQTLALMSFAGVDRRLSELSNALDRPLLPRAVLGSVPPKN